MKIAVIALTLASLGTTFAAPQNAAAPAAQEQTQNQKKHTRKKHKEKKNKQTDQKHNLK